MTNVIIITLTIVNELKQNDMKVTNFEIETEPTTRILIELENGQIVIADFETLSEINENAGMYLNDAFYYKSSIMELCEQFIEEVNEYVYL